MLRQARRSNRHRPHLIFVQGDVVPLRFADEQFDAVFNTLSFLHYPEPEQVFAEVCRVLRPRGGYLVDPAAAGTWHVPVSPNEISLYSKSMRQQMGMRAGFECSKHQFLLGPNLLTIFTKPSSLP